MKRTKVVKVKNTVEPKKSSASPVVILLVIVLGLGIYILINQYSAQIVSLFYPSSRAPETAQVTPEPTPGVSPTPYPIDKGQKTYRFTAGKGTTVPLISQFTVDEHDPGVGTKQTATVHFKHTSPVTGVSMIVETDTQKNTYPMTLVNGTDTDGDWSGSWTVTETHNYTYILTPVVKADGKDIPYKLVIRELP